MQDVKLEHPHYGNRDLTALAAGTRTDTMPDCLSRVIAIVGPTASGKSTVAQIVAGRIPGGGEIVSADAMQIYKGMDIGTAKVLSADRVVPHHCIDLVDPGEPFSAALFQSVSRAAIEAITASGRTPIVVGGTGMYVRAALDSLRFPPGTQATCRRKELEALAREIGPVGVHNLLRIVDPESADVIHPHNVRRTIRALEMADYGTSYAAHASQLHSRESVYDTIFVGLHVERAELYRRIDNRVDAMLSQGLVQEVADLLEAGFHTALTAAQAIGYKEIVPVLAGERELLEAVELIKRASRRYAKRQLTWFRADPRIHWVDVTSVSAEDAASIVSDLLESHSAR